MDRALRVAVVRAGAAEKVTVTASDGERTASVEIPCEGKYCQALRDDLSVGFADSSPVRGAK